MPIPQPGLSRQQFLSGVGVGGAAVVLSACATYGKEESSAPEPSGEESSGAAEPSGSAAPDVLAATAEVPVGSGVIVGDTVLTQPVSGEFKGFSNLCTHAGCRLNSVSDGSINCPCHGSKFNLDGTVAKGPASTPLASTPIVVQGDSILTG